MGLLSITDDVRWDEIKYFHVTTWRLIVKSHNHNMLLKIRINGKKLIVPAKTNSILMIDCVTKLLVIYLLPISDIFYYKANSYTMWHGILSYVSEENISTLSHNFVSFISWFIKLIYLKLKIDQTGFLPNRTEPNLSDFPPKQTLTVPNRWKNIINILPEIFFTEM